jgi:hypothetical protein
VKNIFFVAISLIPSQKVFNPTKPFAVASIQHTKLVQHTSSIAYTSLPFWRSFIAK